MGVAAEAPTAVVAAGPERAAVGVDFRIQEVSTAATEQKPRGGGGGRGNCRGRGCCLGGCVKCGVCKSRRRRRDDAGGWGSSESLSKERLEEKRECCCPTGCCSSCVRRGKRFILRPLAPENLRATTASISLFPLQFTDPDRERRYFEHTSVSFRSRMRIVGTVGVVLYAFFWIIVGLSMRGEELSIFHFGREYNKWFHIAQAICILFLITLSFCDHLPCVGAPWAESLSYCLIAGFFTAYMAWLIIMVLDFNTVPVPTTILDRLEIFQEVANFKLWTDALIWAGYFLALIAIDIVFPSRTKLSWWLHIYMLLLIGAAFCVEVYVFNKYFRVSLTVYLQLIITNGVCMLAFFGRYHSELKERVDFLRLEIKNELLNKARLELESRKKKQTASMALDEVVSLLSKANETIAKVSAKSKIPELGESSNHLMRCMDVLSHPEDLFKIILHADNISPELISAYGGNVKNRSFVAESSRITSKDSSEGRRKRSDATPPQSFGALSRASSLGHYIRKDGTLDVELSGSAGVVWNFDLLELEQRHESASVMLDVGLVLLTREGDCPAENTVTANFLRALEATYMRNPYHNSAHAATTAHAAYYLTYILGLRDLGEAFSPSHKAALVVAALGHDAGHPGRNNQFFIKTRDPLALTYNDCAVLENFHSCLTFLTLNTPGCQLFESLDQEAYRVTRSQIIELILATDMEKHFESVSFFRIRLDSGRFNFNVKDDLNTMLKMIMKASDLSHAFLDWKQHMAWSLRIAEEFYQQGAKERELDVPKSSLCDRDTHPEFARSQIGFLDFVIRPLITELCRADESGRLTHELAGRAEINRRTWEEKIGQEIAIPLEVREMKVNSANMRQLTAKLCMCGRYNRSNMHSVEALKETRLYRGNGPSRAARQMEVGDDSRRRKSPATKNAQKAPGVGILKRRRGSTITDFNTTGVESDRGALIGGGASVRITAGGDENLHDSANELVRKGGSSTRALPVMFAASSAKELDLEAGLSGDDDEDNDVGEQRRPQIFRGDHLQRSQPHTDTRPTGSSSLRHDAGPQREVSPYSSAGTTTAAGSPASGIGEISPAPRRRRAFAGLLKRSSADNTPSVGGGRKRKDSRGSSTATPQAVASGPAASGGTVKVESDDDGDQGADGWSEDYFVTFREHNNNDSNIADDSPGGGGGGLQRNSSRRNSSRRSTGSTRHEPQSASSSISVGSQQLPAALVVQPARRSAPRVPSF